MKRGTHCNDDDNDVGAADAAAAAAGRRRRHPLEPALTRSALRATEHNSPLIANQTAILFALCC